MRHTFFARSMLGLTLLLGIPGEGHALGLGEIRVTSKLGEGLRAEIPVMLRSGEEVKDLEVTLGNPGEYEVMSLARPALVVTIRAKVDRDSRGTRIVLSSNSAIQEPFFNLLLRTSLGRGSQYRNYPVFLDIPLPSAEPARIADKKSAPMVTAPSAKSSGGIVATETVKSPAAAPTAPSRRFSGDSYGPVRRGETLSSIAQQLQEGSGFSESQWMVALWQKNEERFIRNNMNALIAGTLLALPTHDELARVNEQQARAVRGLQRRLWLEHAGVKPVGKREEPAHPIPTAKSGEKSKTGSTTAPKPAKHEVGTKTKPATPAAGREKSPPAPEPVVAYDMRMSVDKGSGEENQAVALQLSKSLGRVQEVEGQLAAVTEKLKQSETSQLELQNRMAMLQKRLEKMDQPKAPPPPAPPPPPPIDEEEEWLLYAAGGGLAALAGGALAWLLRRRKQQGGESGAGATGLLSSFLARRQQLAQKPSRIGEGTPPSFANPEGEGAIAPPPVHELLPLASAAAVAVASATVVKSAPETAREEVEEESDTYFQPMVPMAPQEPKSPPPQPAQEQEKFSRSALTGEEEEEEMGEQGPWSADFNSDETTEHEASPLAIERASAADLFKLAGVRPPDEHALEEIGGDVEAGEQSIFQLSEENILDETAGLNMTNGDELFRQEGELPVEELALDELAFSEGESLFTLSGEGDAQELTPGQLTGNAFSLPLTEEGEMAMNEAYELDAGSEVSADDDLMLETLVNFSLPQSTPASHGVAEIDVPEVDLLLAETLGEEAEEEGLSTLTALAMPSVTSDIEEIAGEELTMVLDWEEPADSIAFPMPDSNELSLAEERLSSEESADSITPPIANGGALSLSEELFSSVEEAEEQIGGELVLDLDAEEEKSGLELSPAGTLLGLGKEEDGELSISIPAFEIVDVDFPGDTGQAPRQEEKPKPVPTWELESVELNLEEDSDSTSS